MCSKVLRIYTLANRLNGCNRLYLYERTLTLQIRDVKNNYEQRRSYRKFGHKPDKIPTSSKLYYTLVTLGVVLPWLNYKAYVKELFII